MSLSRKFAKAAGAGFLGLAMLAGAGCTQPTPAQQQVAAEKDQGIHADDCVVVDKTPGFPSGGYWANTYNFRDGVV